MSGSDSITILCTGDFHLGRYPSRVPAHERELSVAGVWEATVDYAITQDVDVVALTGDVVDRDNRFYESFGPLQRGLSRLADHEISAFAVAGNHDFDVFPRLVEALETDRFHLLGRGGTWETVPFHRNGEVALRFVGWSFPSEHYHSSPTKELDAAELGLDSSEVPTVGLLHAELDQLSSSYAPVSEQALCQEPVDAWLLGHIHKPNCRETNDTLLLYPGSLQPLDPGEEGTHGPWIVRIDRGGSVTTRQVPLASIRYDTIEVDLSGVDSEEAFEKAATGSIQETLQEHANSDTLARVVYRLHCTGRTPIHRKLENYRERVSSKLKVPLGDVTATVDTVILDTRPEHDLDAVAQRSSGPPAALAKLLLDLQDESETHDRLLRKVEQELASVHRSNKYAPLRAHPPTSALPDRSDVKELLVRQGMMLLDELLAQKDNIASHE